MIAIVRTPSALLSFRRLVILMIDMLTTIPDSVKVAFST